MLPPCPVLKDSIYIFNSDFVVVVVVVLHSKKKMAETLKGTAGTMLFKEI